MPHLRITGLSLAAFQLTDRTQPVVRGDVNRSGSVAEEIACFRRGKAIGSALVLDRVLALTATSLRSRIKLTGQ